MCGGGGFFAYNPFEFLNMDILPIQIFKKYTKPKTHSSTVISVIEPGSIPSEQRLI